MVRIFLSPSPFIFTFASARWQRRRKGGDGVLWRLFCDRCTSRVFRTFSSLPGRLFNSTSYFMQVLFCLVEWSRTFLVTYVSMKGGRDGCIIVPPTWREKDRGISLYQSATSVAKKMREPWMKSQLGIQWSGLKSSQKSSSRTDYTLDLIRMSLFVHSTTMCDQPELHQPLTLPFLHLAGSPPLTDSSTLTQWPSPTH